MRLRNRIVKATYWTDPDLCRWHRDKREFYRSLWSCAEDSCCLEDDMFGVKLAAWPSPLDVKMSAKQFERWRDEIIEEGKLVRYEAGGQRFLYIPSMARHEAMNNPQSADLPLPPWVSWVKNSSDQRKGRYVHDFEMLQSLHNGCATDQNGNPTVPVLDCTVLDCTDQKFKTSCSSPGPMNTSDEQPPGFDEWWKAYPRKQSKGTAIRAYKTALKRASPADLLAALRWWPFPSDRQYQPLPATWLNGQRWLDEIPEEVTPDGVRIEEIKQYDRA